MSAWARLLLALSWLVSTSAAALEPFSAQYTVSLGGMAIGESERRLERLGKNAYRYSAQTQGSGVAALLIKDTIRETSRFRLEEGELRALEYAYQRQGGKREKQSHVRFDWAQGLAEGENGGQPWQVAIGPGVYDALSYQLAASLDLKRGRTRLSYRVADEGELKPFDLVVAGEETVDTPLGALATLRLERDDGKRSTVLWLAPALDYLPVRIDYSEGDGRRYTARLRAFTKMVR